MSTNLSHILVELANVTAARNVELERLYLAGNSVRAVSELSNMTTTEVRNVLCERGTTIRSRGKYKAAVTLSEVLPEPIIDIQMGLTTGMQDYLPEAYDEDAEAA